MYFFLFFLSQFSTDIRKLISCLFVVISFEFSGSFNFLGRQSHTESCAHYYFSFSLLLNPLCDDNKQYFYFSATGSLCYLFLYSISLKNTKTEFFSFALLTNCKTALASPKTQLLFLSINKKLFFFSRVDSLQSNRDAFLLIEKTNRHTLACLFVLFFRFLSGLSLLVARLYNHFHSLCTSHANLSISSMCRFLSFTFHHTYFSSLKSFLAFQ